MGRTAFSQGLGMFFHMHSRDVNAITKKMIEDDE